MDQKHGDDMTILMRRLFYLFSITCTSLGASEGILGQGPVRSPLDRIPSTAYTDVNFRDLVKAPTETVTGIFERFDRAIPGDLAANIDRYLQSHPRDEYGIHEYSLERYGLNPEMLQSEYKPYIEFFDVPLETRSRR